MTIFKTADITELLCMRTGESAIVFNCWNNGTSSRWFQQFPSLTEDQINALDEPCAIFFENSAEARSVFETVCRDFADNDDGGLIGGTIRLLEQTGESDHVNSLRTIRFDLDDRDRPVYTDGEWHNEMIASRI